MTDGSLSLVKVLNDCQKEVKQSLRASQNNFNFNGRKFQTKYRQLLNSQAPEPLTDTERSEKVRYRTGVDVFVHFRSARIQW